MVGFADDLRAWTIAELRRRNAGRSTLAHEIRRLIDYPFQNELEPPADRGAITGRVGVAIRAQPVPVEPSPCDPLIESGLWTADAGAAGIYTSMSLAAYYAGSGDTWDWGADAYIHGTIAAGSQSCSGPMAPVFSGAPTLNADNAYSSANALQYQQQWFQDLTRAPYRYTGLMRLVAQAFGVRRNLATLPPDGWPAMSPVNYGVLRQVDATAGTLRYWLVYAGSDGCKAVALQWCPTVQCLAAGLYAGTYSGAQRLRAETAVLSTLSVPAEATGTEVITSSGMDAAHGNGYGPLAHGWHWSPQTIGTTSETATDAIMLSVEETDVGGWGWDTVRCTLTLTFTGTTPSAVLSTANAGRTGLRRLMHRLYIATDEAGNYRHTEHLDGQDEQDGDIWGVYRSSGPDWVTYAERHYIDSKPYEPYLGAVAGCGSVGSSARYVFGPTTGWWSGGFNVTGGTIEGNPFYEQWERLSGAIEGAGTVSGYFANAGGNRQCDGVLGQTVWENGSIVRTCFEGANVCENQICFNSPVTIHTGVAVHNTVYIVADTSEDQGAALLISADPTIYFAARQKSGSLQNNTSTTVHRSDGPGAVRTEWRGQGDAGMEGCEIAGGQASHAVGGWSSGSQSGSPGGGVYYSENEWPEWNEVHMGDAVANVSVTGTYAPYGEAGASITLEQDLVLFHEGGEVALITTQQSLGLTSENPHWDYMEDICRPYTTSNIIGPTGIASYSGALAYNANIGDGWATTVDHDQAIATADFVRWIGHE